MPINVIDTIKQKNNAEFPVVEAADIKGGFRSVATVAERDALGAYVKEAGMWVHVQEDDTVYQLASGLSSWNEVSLGTPGVTYESNNSPLQYHLGTDYDTVYYGTFYNNNTQALIDMTSFTGVYETTFSYTVPGTSAPLYTVNQFIVFLDDIIEPTVVFNLVFGKLGSTDYILQLATELNTFSTNIYSKRGQTVEIALSVDFDNQTISFSVDSTVILNSAPLNTVTELFNSQDILGFLFWSGDTVNHLQAQVTIGNPTGFLAINKFYESYLGEEVTSVSQTIGYADFTNSFSPNIKFFQVSGQLPATISQGETGNTIQLPSFDEYVYLGVNKELKIDTPNELLTFLDSPLAFVSDIPDVPTLIISGVTYPGSAENKTVVVSADAIPSDYVVNSFSQLSSLPTLDTTKIVLIKAGTYTSPLPIDSDNFTAVVFEPNVNIQRINSYAIDLSPVLPTGSVINIYGSNNLVNCDWGLYLYRLSNTATIYANIWNINFYDTSSSGSTCAIFCDDYNSIANLTYVTFKNCNFKSNGSYPLNSVINAFTTGGSTAHILFENCNFYNTTGEGRILHTTQVAPYNQITSVTFKNCHFMGAWYFMDTEKDIASTVNFINCILPLDDLVNVEGSSSTVIRGYNNVIKQEFTKIGSIDLTNFYYLIDSTCDSWGQPLQILGY